MQTDALDKPFYADGMTEHDKTEAKMQGAMDRVSQALRPYKKHKKTEFVYQPVPGKPYSEPTIPVNG